MNDLDIQHTFGTKLLVGIPTGQHGQVHFDCMFGAIGCAKELGVIPVVRTGRYIEESRDVLAALCISGGHSHLLLVSPTVRWVPDDVMALINAEKDVVSGSFEPPDSGSTEGLIETDFAPAAFLLLSRKAILQLAWESPEAHYVVDGSIRVQALWAGNVQWRDEVAFSERCKAAGLTMWRHAGAYVIDHGTLL